MIVAKQAQRADFFERMTEVASTRVSGHSSGDAPCPAWYYSKEEVS